MSKLSRNYTILYVIEPDLSKPDLNNLKQDFFYLQTSLLYTNDQRQRVIRVHNSVIRISDYISEVYSAINYQALLSCVMRMNLVQFCSLKPFTDIQIELTNIMKKIFAGISHNTPTTYQTELLPYLALGFLGILKNMVFQAQYINNCELNR